MSTRVRKKLSELLCELKVKEIWVSSKNTSTLKKLYGNKAQARNLEELDQLWSKVKVLSIYPDKKSGRGALENAPLLMLSYGEFKLLLAKNFMPESLAVELRPDIISFNPGGVDLVGIKRFILSEQQVKGFIISGYEKYKFSRTE